MPKRIGGTYAAAVIAITVASACGGSAATSGASAGGAASGSVGVAVSGAGGMPASVGGTLGGADGTGCTGGSSGDNALLCQPSQAGGGLAGGLHCAQGTRSIAPSGTCDFPGECHVLPPVGERCCDPGGCALAASSFACSCALDHTLQCVDSDSQPACLSEGGAMDASAP
jgi:hypothetical protein